MGASNGSCLTLFFSLLQDVSLSSFLFCKMSNSLLFSSARWMINTQQIPRWLLSPWRPGLGGRPIQVDSPPCQNAPVSRNTRHQSTWTHYLPSWGSTGELLFRLLTLKHEGNVILTSNILQFSFVFLTQIYNSDDWTSNGSTTTCIKPLLILSIPVLQM